MKDHEAVTLKAFLFALAQQTDPLAADLQDRLNQIGKNLNANISNLDAIARDNPNLRDAYKAARKWLDSPQERNKGLDFTPNASAEKQNPESGAIDNTSQLHSSTPLEALLQELEKTNDKALSEITTSILKSANSVKAAPWFISNLPS
jgi:hypothetical protein